MAGVVLRLTFCKYFKVYNSNYAFRLLAATGSYTHRYVQGYETAYKRAFVISIAFGLMSQPIKFRFSSLQTTAVVPLPK